MSIHVWHTNISHRFGVDTYLGLSKEILQREVANYCRTWWWDIFNIDEERGCFPPNNLTDQEIIQKYFEAAVEAPEPEFIDEFRETELSLSVPGIQVIGGL
jgi:hypothetical protein